MQKVSWPSYDDIQHKLIGPWVVMSPAICQVSGDGVKLSNPELPMTDINFSLYTVIVCSMNIYIYIYIHMYVYIYIYTRNACVLPRRCRVEVSHSQTNADATSQNSPGKNNKGTTEY